MWVCTCARRWDRPSVCAFVCACVYVLLCIWSPYTVIALLLRLTVRLHVNLIKKQRKPLNKLHVSSLCLPISHLASSIIRFSHLSICSLECKSISMCSLLPCLCTPSLTVCSLPVPLLLLFLHLPLLSSIRASSFPPPPPISLTLASLPPFLYVSGGSAGSLLSGTYPDIPQLGSQTSQTGNRADRMTKADQREEGRLTARQLLQLDWQAGGKAIKK